jgi:L-threonylcarbamoyladenylate synthase
LRRGGVALLPAEGVYGLHARAEDPAAVERLLAMKPRPGKKGWIGLIGEPGDADRWAETGPRAEALIRKHWPGALTLVLRAKPAIPASMRNDDGTIALRCPGSDFLRAVVRNATGLVISTSANEPGAPPLTRLEDFSSEIVDLVVDQGPLSGTPSTVVLIQTDGVTVLREGAVRIDAS